MKKKNSLALTPQAVESKVLQEISDCTENCLYDFNFYMIRILNP